MEPNFDKTIDTRINDSKHLGHCCPNPATGNASETAFCVILILLSFNLNFYFLFLLNSLFSFTVIVV